MVIFITLYTVVSLRFFLNTVENDQEIQRSVKTATLAGRQSTQKSMFYFLKKAAEILLNIL